ncbi:calcineurin B-like protein 4 [Tanacetum coccineum]
MEVSHIAQNVEWECVIRALSSFLIRHKFIALDTPTRELLKEKNRALDVVMPMLSAYGFFGLSRIDDEVVQDQRQRYDNDLQDERQDQPKEEEMKADGTIDKYKARLAIKGFRQQGLHYFDTYTMRITSVKMILAIVALRNSEVHQMDMKMTFLKGDLEKVLYMNQLEGFMAPGLESKVYHNLWDIIVDGDLQEEVTLAGEQSGPPAPKTAKQLTAKRNQEIVMRILLLAIPD